MVTLDDADEVVRPALLWNDTRSAQDATDLTEEFGGAQRWADRGRRRAGRVVHRHQAPLAAPLPSPSRSSAPATCVLPHDWLTGQILKQGNGFDGWTTDRGDASGTGYWSAGSGAYLPELLDLAVGRSLEVPRVLGPTEAAGRTGVRHGARRPGPATTRAPRSASGCAPATRSSRWARAARRSPGTTRPSPTPRAPWPPSPTRPATSSRCSPPSTPPGCMTAGASMLGVELAELDRLATLAAEPGAGGLTLLPYLDGERTPNLPTATGTLSGLTRANATPENLARAVVEGMVTNLAEALDALRGQGVGVERVLLIGGAAASAAVRSMAADLFGVPVHVPASGEYVALGAARQAAATLAGTDLPEWEVRTEAVVEPDAAPRADAELRGRYADLRGPCTTARSLTRGRSPSSACSTVVASDPDSASDSRRRAT